MKWVFQLYSCYIVAYCYNITIPVKKLRHRAFPETSCVKFYDAEGGAGQLRLFCMGAQCTCAEGKQEALCSFCVATTSKSRRGITLADFKELKFYSVMFPPRREVQCAEEWHHRQRPAPKKGLRGDPRGENSLRWARMYVWQEAMQRVSWPSASGPTVYKVRVEESSGDLFIDTHRMTILLVIREGWCFCFGWRGVFVTHTHASRLKYDVNVCEALANH